MIDDPNVVVSRVKYCSGTSAGWCARQVRNDRVSAECKAYGVLLICSPSVMGAALNPRAFGGRLDLKMWSELRVSWVTLFLLTISAAAKQRRCGLDDGVGSTVAIGGTRVSEDDSLHFLGISGASWLMLTAHWLYANACQKGEESVPFTWDIFHEKWGWMLIWWNLAGVPFFYCANAFFIAQRKVQLSSAATWTLLIVLLAAYYVWDTAQSQRTRFRMKLQRLYVERPWAFPVLPW